MPVLPALQPRPAEWASLWSMALWIDHEILPAVWDDLHLVAIPERWHPSETACNHLFQATRSGALALWGCPRARGAARRQVSAGRQEGSLLILPRLSGGERRQIPESFLAALPRALFDCSGNLTRLQQFAAPAESDWDGDVALWAYSSVEGRTEDLLRLFPPTTAGAIANVGGKPEAVLPHPEFRPGVKTSKQAEAEAQAETWLKEFVIAHQLDIPRPSREDVREAARELFGLSLSGQAFQRLWLALAPRAWRQKGRIKGRRLAKN